ncbi:flagellar motor switch phosphatase FliY [Halobacillus naozhouensis]|uniref:Flagellar motor switch phosphatase FliY n=1 Tax=Halobacillus naozhouensis TaxID=554880 RepID=A0ABY8J774_9BACI|nr:flagellar motor switch phosphatase FliY [Halobacillus naozhouensis]WFT76746.1 flagellar motor switch phosphatase FliY [Halobacillus naozhouensis]
MNDDMLSQDEIDALLNGTVDEEGDERKSQKAQESTKVEDFLSSLEQDALGEIGNISFGSSATALSSLLNQKVDITTPSLSIVKRSSLSEEFPKPHVAINVTYTDGFSGENLLVIREPDAAVIADLMLGGDGTNPSEDLNEIHLSAVQEAMNQMMGSAATSMSTVFNKKVDISPPVINVLNLEENQGTDQIPADEALMKVSFNLKVGNLIDSAIMQLLPVSFARELVDQLLDPPVENGDASEQKTASERADEQLSRQTATTSQTQHPSAEKDPEPQLVGGASGQQLHNSTIQTAEFSDMEPVQLSNNEQRNLDMLMDIPLKVTVELGRTKRTIKEILELSAGSVVELDRLAGEPVDIHVNDKLMAKGEVVVIDESFGVRVTDILSPKDRLKKLK